MKKKLRNVLLALAMAFMGACSTSSFAIGGGSSNIQAYEQCRNYGKVCV